MSEDEAASFEGQLDSDPDLTQELEIFKKLTGGMQKAARASLRDAVRKEIEKAENGGGQVPWRWIGGIAASALLVGAVYLQYPRDGSEVQIEDYEPADYEEYVQDSLDNVPPDSVFDEPVNPDDSL